MKRCALILLCLCWLSAAWADEVKLTGGPAVSIVFAPEQWGLFGGAAENRDLPRESQTFELLPSKAVQITVRSRKDTTSYAAFRKELEQIQSLRGDPAEIVGERKQLIAGREWTVTDCRNRNTKPPRSEIHYFLERKDGSIMIFLIGDETELPKHQAAVDAFLAGVQPK